MAANTWKNRIVGTGEEAPGQLVANPRNYRLHPQFQQDGLQTVLDEVGWVRPVLVNKRTGFVIDGHLRVTLAVQNDEPSVPVEYVDLNEHEEAQVLAALDPLVGLATPDPNLLKALSEEVDLEPFWNPEELAGVLAQADAPSGNGETPGKDVEPPIDRAAELQKKYGTELGQVWELGKHRLVCGDCTDGAVVEAVMRGEKADLLFTDPPYNVAGEGSNFAADVRDSHQRLADSSWDYGFSFKGCSQNCLNVLSDTTSVYVCSSQFLASEIWAWMKEWADFYSYIVWCKPNPMPSLSKRQWTWATELICYGTRGKHTFHFPETGHALNWWEIISPSHETSHPTEKPITIPSMAISHSSNEGQIVYDPFLGSGTTLIACENLNRRCRAIEIDPGYVAVALERWATLTGREPNLMK